MNDEERDDAARVQLEQAAQDDGLLAGVPRALSEDERQRLLNTPQGKRALELIDDLTAALAEAVARMTVAERSNETNSRLFGSAQRDLDASNALLTDFKFSSAEYMCDWLRRRLTHLSGQPAAPARTERADGSTFMRDPTDGGRWCTEAEQAVLDTCRQALTVYQNRHPHDDFRFGMTDEMQLGALLARRGLR